jgi:hypothetical protein
MDKKKISNKRYRYLGIVQSCDETDVIEARDRLRQGIQAFDYGQAL